MKDNAKNNFPTLAMSVVLMASTLNPFSARAEIPNTNCSDRLNIFIDHPNLSACAGCHGGQSPVQAPKWMATPQAIFNTWNGTLESNTSGEDNILMAKARQPQTPHGGGKAFNEATLSTLQSELSELLSIGCLPVHDTSGESNLARPGVPFYTNLRKRFVALVGEESAAVREISKYALQLGRADFRVAQNSRFTLTPSTAGIIERVVLEGCHELSAQKGWATLSEKKWLNSFTNLIVSTTGLPLGNAYTEANQLNAHFAKFRAEQKAVLACATVLRSERFLLP